LKNSQGSTSRKYQFQSKRKGSNADLIDISPKDLSELKTDEKPVLSNIQSIQKLDYLNNEYSQSILSTKNKKYQEQEMKTERVLPSDKLNQFKTRFPLIG